MSAVLTTIWLAACAPSNSAREPLAHQLPPAPGFAQPVAAPEPQAGDSALAVAARERAGRLAANQRIVALRRWYEGVRRDYAS
jgi:hypothetical protein